MTDTQPEAPTKPTTTRAKVGDLIDVPDRAQVARPNGDLLTVGDGLYYLDVPGTHTVYDGKGGETRYAVR